ncbi:MAG: hypothetical protein J0H91_01205, partial [Rhodospirillales bacterium]|nr:hypothetical protein [Rhodospirillales bacterium]
VLFEKKNQKTFVRLDCGSPRRWTARIKFFCFFFSKKRSLSFLLRSSPGFMLRRRISVDNDAWQGKPEVLQHAETGGAEHPRGLG